VEIAACLKQALPLSYANPSTPLGIAIPFLLLNIITQFPLGIYLLVLSVAVKAKTILLAKEGDAV
jgi:hypothetical protein